MQTKKIVYHTQLSVHNCNDWLNIAVKFLLTLEDVVDDEAGSQSQECALPPSSAPPPLRNLFGTRCCATSSARKLCLPSILRFTIAIVYYSNLVTNSSSPAEISLWKALLCNQLRRENDYNNSNSGVLFKGSARAVNS